MIAAMRRMWLAAALISTLIGMTWAQPVSEKAQLIQVAESLLPYFSKEPPASLEEKFSKSFRQALTQSKIRLDAVFQDMYKRFGKATKVRYIRGTGGFAADVEFVFAKGVRVPTRLVIEGSPPWRVTSLQFRAAARDKESIRDIIADLRQLPGSVAFALMRLAPTKRVLWELHSTRAMPVGSCMKLVVFAALVGDIRAGKRSWDDQIRVRREWASLPSGLLHDWPDGTPITLETLALLMLTKSDNTAADHLIRTIGRQRIEEFQKELGIASPEKNIPYLCTGELFRLKLVLGPEQQRQYVQATPEQRRKLLDTMVNQVSLEQHRTLAAPALINDVEWFFTPGDMCRVMDWLRRQNVPHVREILAVNQGFSLDEDHWSYVAYKGGAEPGVLNFTLLLQDRRGRWFAFSIAWNNPEEELDQTLLMIHAMRLLRLAEKL